MGAKYKPPAIRTRKHEVDEIVALLESADFDTAEQMARKVMSVAFGLLLERDWWVVAVLRGGVPGGPITLYGTFATEAAAIAAVEKNALALLSEDRTAIYEIKGLSGRQAELDAHEDTLTHDCAVCGHPEVGHHWPRAKVKTCVVGRCGCAEYVRPQRAIERIEAV